MRKLVEAEQQTKLTGHRWEVTCLEFSPNGLHLASSGWDKEVRLWDLNTLETWGFLTNQHQFPITSLAWKPQESSNILATTSSDETACIWNTDTGEVLSNLEHDNWVLDCSFNLSGAHLATGSWDKILRIWDVETARSVNSFTGHSSGIWTCEFSPVSPHVVCSGTDDGSVKIFDTRNGSLVLSLIGGHEDSVKCCSWSTDGKYLASGGADMKIAVWDASVGNVLSKIRGHEDTVMDLKFYPVEGAKEMPFILSTGDNTCRFWHAMRKVNKELMCLKQHENGSEVQCLAISQDGTLLATGGRDTQIVLSSLNVLLDEIEALSLSDQEVTSNHGAKLWKKYTRKLIQRISVSGSEGYSSDYKSSEEEESNSDTSQHDPEVAGTSTANIVGTAIQHRSGVVHHATSKEHIPSNGTILLKTQRSGLRHIDENDNTHYNGLPAPNSSDNAHHNPNSEEVIYHSQPSTSTGAVFHHRVKQDALAAFATGTGASDKMNGVVTHRSMNNGVLVHHGKSKAPSATNENAEGSTSRL